MTLQHGTLENVWGIIRKDSKKIRMKLEWLYSEPNQNDSDDVRVYKLSKNGVFCNNFVILI